jgi:hypothetical protein
MTEFLKDVPEYQQNYQQSCLIQCLAFCSGRVLSLEAEGELMKRALLRENMNYALGCAKVCGEEFGVDFVVSYHYKRWADTCKTKSVSEVVCQKIDARFISEILMPTPVYIDMFGFGGDVHEPHWITILKSERGKVEYLEPAFGQIRSCMKDELLDAIKNLNQVLGFCPAAVLYGDVILSRPPYSAPQV